MGFTQSVTEISTTDRNEIVCGSRELSVGKAGKLIAKCEPIVWTILDN
jgi:hypothetical protein